VKHEQNKVSSEKKQNEYYNIFLTDIQIHAIEPRKPIPWYRAILKSFRNRKPGRFYTTHFEMNDKNRAIKLIFPPSLKVKQQMKEAKKLGKKIRFILPKNGVPVYLGKDAIEKLEAEKRKQKKKILETMQNIS